MYIKFDDARASLKAIQSEPLARAHIVAPIFRIESSFALSKSHLIQENKKHLVMVKLVMPHLVE